MILQRVEKRRKGIISLNMFNERFSDKLNDVILWHFISNENASLESLFEKFSFCNTMALQGKQII